MKTTIDFTVYSRIYGLGVEVWFPRCSDWKRFQIQVTVGPISAFVTLGSKAQYDAECKLLRGAE